MKSIFSGFHYDSSSDEELHMPPSLLPPPTHRVPIDPTTVMVVYEPHAKSTTQLPAPENSTSTPSFTDEDDEICDSSSSPPKKVPVQFPVVDLTGDVPKTVLANQGISSRLCKRHETADTDSRDAKRPTLARDKGVSSSRSTSSKEFDSKWFVSSDAARRELIDQAGLLKTVTQVGAYDSDVVYEFWANLPAAKVERESVDVLVRDWMYEFSPSRINALFGLQSVDVREQRLQTAAILEEDMALFLSGGTVKSCKQLVSTAIKNQVIKDLHKICCSNWSPTVNTGYISTNRAMVIYMIMHHIPFNFGRMIYDQIIQLGLQAQSDFRLSFPSLIY
ncbi:PREDICTED: uncharacterized protein LOC104772734 [Camelina sativa]|uniref:Uncharacterized protein LOC104772734 n=1 Tax=Camelina sativa TaxID=90675 RepID=A0ABM0Y515_CAMSA|nr:PREDICTED: uncharacterized protein LOC104772734 [Camelina sativa]